MAFPLNYRNITPVAEYTDDELKHLNALRDRKADIDAEIATVKAAGAVKRQIRMAAQHASDTKRLRALLPETGILLTYSGLRTDGSSIWWPNSSACNLLMFCNEDVRLFRGHAILWALQKLLYWAKDVTELLSQHFPGDVSSLIVPYAVEFALINDSF